MSPILSLGFYMYLNESMKKRIKMMDNAKNGLARNTLLSCFVQSGLKITQLRDRVITYQMIEKALLLYKTQN